MVMRRVIREDSITQVAPSSITMKLAADAKVSKAIIAIISKTQNNDKLMLARMQSKEVYQQSHSGSILTSLYF